MEKSCLFKGRVLPNIFSVLDPISYSVSYDDNVIGDEHYNVQCTWTGATMVVRVIPSPLPVIAFRQLGFGRDPLKDKSLLLNEDINKYSDVDITLIKHIFKALEK